MPNKTIKIEQKEMNKRLKQAKRVGMTNYPVGDFLIRLKNTAMAKGHKVTVPRTRLIEETAELLKKEGYIAQVKIDGNLLIVDLAYVKKEPVLITIRLVSKPGLRIYNSAVELGANRGPQILIVSTSKGLMSNRTAIKNNLGGEVIAEVL